MVTEGLHEDSHTGRNALTALWKTTFHEKGLNRTVREVIQQCFMCIEHSENPKPPLLTLAVQTLESLSREGLAM